MEFVTSKLPKDNKWFCDREGLPAAGFGLCLSTEDLNKIGEMCLNEGSFGNKRIVSSEWIKQMVKPRIKCSEKFNCMQYGYLWWILDDKKNIYAAIGDSGNVLYINNDKRVVVSITATFKPRVLDRVDFIEKYLIPYSEQFVKNE